MSDESLFREVDEEVRQEQFKKLWARYGKFVIGLAVLVILGVSGMEGWRFWQARQSEQAGDSFFAATELAASGKAADAVKQFEAIGKTGFADLGRLRAAAAAPGLRGGAAAGRRLQQERNLGGAGAVNRDSAKSRRPAAPAAESADLPGGGSGHCRPAQGPHPDRSGMAVDRRGHQGDAPQP